MANTKAIDLCGACRLRYDACLRIARFIFIFDSASGFLICRRILRADGDEEPASQIDLIVVANNALLVALTVKGDFIMTSAELRESIIGILKEIAPDEDYDGLKDDVSFRTQLEMDSMDMLDVVLGLRRLYKLPIPESDYPRLDSMNSTIEYLLPLLNEKE